VSEYVGKVLSRRGRQAVRVHGGAEALQHRLPLAGLGERGGRRHCERVGFALRALRLRLLLRLRLQSRCLLLLLGALWLGASGGAPSRRSRAERRVTAASLARNSGG